MPYYDDFSNYGFYPTKLSVRFQQWPKISIMFLFYA